MPKIGEIKRGEELNKKAHHFYIYSPCVNCDIPRKGLIDGKDQQIKELKEEIHLLKDKILEGD